MVRLLCAVVVSVLCMSPASAEMVHQFRPGKDTLTIRSHGIGLELVYFNDPGQTSQNTTRQFTWNGITFKLRVKVQGASVTGAEMLYVEAPEGYMAWPPELELPDGDSQVLYVVPAGS